MNQGTVSVPVGFHAVTVTLSDAEYQTLYGQGLLTAPGTVAAALRHQAGMPQEPYGIRVARLRAALADDEMHQHGADR